MSLCMLSVGYRCIIVSCKMHYTLYQKSKCSAAFSMVPYFSHLLLVSFCPCISTIHVREKRAAFRVPAVHAKSIFNWVFFFLLQENDLRSLLADKYA